jgi:G:T-mismatch repair DNA endonuclease (very short patch repair protein)
MSTSAKGKPKPWLCGNRNPNFQNKAQGTPEARDNFLKSVKLRGQAWTEEHRKQHSVRMLGSSNAMRGKSHTPESIRAISEAKQKQYQEGTVKITRNKLSKDERSIARVLRMNGVQFKTQFHIQGIPYLYDFFFPDLGLIIEYQGNYWHANPAHYPPGTLLPIQSKGKVRVEDIWERDAKKREAAILAGYKVAYVWEADYKVRGLSTIYELLNG